MQRKYVHNKIRKNTLRGSRARKSKSVDVHMQVETNVWSSQYGFALSERQTKKGNMAFNVRQGEDGVNPIEKEKN